MFSMGVALAATPSPAELAAHQQAVVDAHRRFDYSALEALFTEDGGPVLIALVGGDAT